MKMSAFRTRDGYVLHPVAETWTDGIIVFDRHPQTKLPMDSNGELVDGTEIDNQGLTE